ncbi:RICIN domain-containing protein [Embleya sp. AB8]|uniref:RICIN domain-containing protein n=1 Tax=Embleya sp. AB8 TaxID=3156304 RepID=UPI003C747B68
MGNDRWRIANVNSSLCLLTRVHQGARVVTCEPWNDQLWWVYPLPSGYYQFMNIETRTCLVPQGPTMDAQLMQGSCVRGSEDPTDQRWYAKHLWA